ncbi:tetratricopeptide repeat protein [Candidatus Falkowbacteria bacterium]|nr:tetratricopeptide repeat protein [Candidatus Falkowbacteria bacterium]
MKTRSIIVSGVFFFFAIFFGTTASAASIKDAEGFMKAGQYPQAIAVLEGITEKSPTNALAQYELGNCYAMTRDLRRAEERYKAAIKLDAKYGQKIASVFKLAGREALNNNLAPEAQVLYFKAVEYQPSLRQPLADELYKEGERLVMSGLIGLEDSKFAVAGSLSPKTADQICKLYTGIGDKADDDSCPLFYLKGRNFCQGYNEKTGQRLVEIAKRLAKQPGREAQTKVYKDVASIFLGDRYVEKQVPSILTLDQDGYLGFELKGNEQSPWVKIGYGSFEFSHSQNAAYKIVLENGSEYSMNAPLPKIECNLKIIALKESEIFISFKKK